ncbi:MAG: glycosyltransferase family 2 protein [Vicinamibacterales bacterium]
MTGLPELSVVVPFFNEEQNAAAVVRELASVLTRIGRSFELVLVDDGSVDRTAGVLVAAAREVPGCRVLRHAGNAGQAAALWNGLHAARGGILVTLDGDGQNDPSSLPDMLALLASADLVVGVRRVRHDAWPRRAMSAIANGARRRWLRDGAHDAGCALRVFRREVLATLLPIQSLYSFIPACAAAAGLRVVEHPVPHRPRRFGKSSYGLRVMWWRPLIDMLALGWLGRRRLPRVPVLELAGSTESQQPEGSGARLREDRQVVPRQ